jgi:hypothetical protein
MVGNFEDNLTAPIPLLRMHQARGIQKDQRERVLGMVRKLRVKRHF